MEKSIIIWWPRWSWKTHVLQAILETNKKRKWVDLDKYITDKLWTDISTFVKEHWADWWYKFRQTEQQSLEEIINNSDYDTISLWWGTHVFKEVSDSQGNRINPVYNQQNILKSKALRVFLDCSPETSYERITAEKEGERNRPLISSTNLLQDLRDAYNDRKLAYLWNADLIIEVWGKTIQQIVEEILKQAA